MSTLPVRRLRPEEYLKIEREAPFKSEYLDGILYVMAGAREVHDLIAGNAYFRLRSGFRSPICRAHTSDMRVRTASEHYAYPDASAYRGEARFLDDTRDVLLNPSVIIEVLSPSTEAYHRGKKFELYQAIPSLREYHLIAGDRIHADLYIRQPNGHWMLSSFASLEDEIEIPSVECRLKLSELYEFVEFDALL